MVTTIQIHEQAKAELDKLKESKESYEDVILRIVKQFETQKRRQEKILEKGYKEMAEESLKICEEFKYADAEVQEKYGN